KAELEQKIKTENPKNIPPPTRAAAREASSPPPAPGTNAAAADRGPAGGPGPRGGRAGRVAPGATQVPSLGQSPIERGEGKPGARKRPEAAPAPGQGVGRVSPAPGEEGRPGVRSRSVVTPRPAGPREGASPSQFERGRARSQETGRSLRPGAANEATGA